MKDNESCQLPVRMNLDGRNVLSESTRSTTHGIGVPMTPKCGRFDCEALLQILLEVEQLLADDVLTAKATNEASHIGQYHKSRNSDTG